MASSNKTNTQNLGSLSSSKWHNGIWGNIGGSINSHRDTTSSRGSDELSPTAPSGSAQLNSLAEPTAWNSRVWTPANTTPNNVSPTHTKNNFTYVYNESKENPSMYTARQSISQGTSLSSRTMPPGPVDSPTSLRYNAVVGGMVNEERGSSGYYYLQNTSQLNSDAAALNRRNSTDPGFLGTGHNRPGAFSSRQPETNASTLASQFPESALIYPKGAHSNSEHQRPSISNASVSMASETTRGQAFTFSNDSAHTDFNEAFRRGMSLEDTMDSLNGYASNGYSNSAVQPFQPNPQPNPNSQPWQYEINNGSRNFSHGNQQDAWVDAPHTSYSNARRGSVERSSPAGSSYRPQLNSPRNLSGTPNIRTDAWNRPIQRNPIVPQDLDRQQGGSQNPHQSPGCFTPYYGSQIPQYSASYDQYTQVPGYRHQVPAPGYGMQMNYISLALPPGRDKDPAQGTRSQLLEEFRTQSKANRRFDLKDIYNHVVEFCGDQHGSRFIQDKLAVANSEEKDHVFRELEPNALQLMRDVFGNYVIQKFFEFGNQVQKKHLASLMKGKVVDLSLQMYSCRVVQKALEHVLVEQQREIVEELRPSIVQVAKDQNGNHVIQKVVEWFPDISVPLVMEAFQGQIEHLAAHNYGCRVIQRILEYGTPAEKKRLMTDIHLCTAKLLTDQYGNYVIQHIISQGEPEDRSIIIRQVIDRALALSKHKYASNIVEKCIQFGTTDERNAICAKLTAQNGDGTNPLPVSMKDQYGNYVVQKMVEYLQGPEKTAFASNVMDYIPLLKKPGGGRQNAGLDRLYAAVQPVLNPSESDTRGDATTAGTAPSTPNLAVEASSAVPTPSLTTEQNSPQSSSPPSTSISTIDETSEEAKTATVSRPEKAPSPVCVEEN
ncbi:ARM repeat-containing protein [Xylaria grammica]|nr:ARM repeat-containing protein [Xylaria grammica]